ncbi:MAG: type I-E CRISPR-associated protein Cas6/Cse3/CasE [Anaerolineaceae bacterium]|jgi:CRISPR system Cascade subunit CasE
MYLSRLMLNPRSRQVQRELADLYEMHRTVSRAFPKGVFRVNRQNGDATDVLFRVDVHPRTGAPTLLVQSRQPPDWSYLSDDRKSYLLGLEELPVGVENPAVKPIRFSLKAGQVLAFRLRANPTVKKDREDKKQGYRVGLYREEDQLKWLERKVELAGAILLTVQVSKDERAKGKLFLEAQDDKRMRFVSVQFDGILQVKDPARLREAVETGIGSGKAMGFGLLSLARAN